VAYSAVLRAEHTPATVRITGQQAPGRTNPGKTGSDYEEQTGESFHHSMLPRLGKPKTENGDPRAPWLPGHRHLPLRAARFEA
jgi:hypothetical protein